MIHAERSTLGLALLSLAACSGGEQAPPAPQPKKEVAAAAASADRRELLMDEIEGKLVMPAGAKPLASYARSYAYDEKEKATPGLVIGIYDSLTRDRKPGRRWVTQDALPKISDGGCGIVVVRYDPAAGKVVSAFCQGLA